MFVDLTELLTRRAGLSASAEFLVYCATQICIARTCRRQTTSSINAPWAGHSKSGAYF